MRYTGKILTLLIFAGAIPGCQYQSKSETAQVQPEKKPNVIFLLADQWRAQATGYNEDPNLVGFTPHLDRMAENGIHFRNAISVCPVCTPYRAALLTGKYPTTTGMFFNDIQLPAEEFTMAEIFQESGYQTAYIGKWHLDGMGRDQFTPPERRQGFEYWKALECSHDYQHLIYYEGDSREKKLWEGYGPYAETEDAISYIKQSTPDDKPFLMVLSWGTPHFPHHNAPADLLQRFCPEDIVLRDNVSEEMESSAKRESTGYYAHIVALDSCVGMLQKALDEKGLSRNTILVFTSDHGEMMGSQGVRPKQKQVPWAESVRVPFLLRYPARFGDEKITVNVPLNTPDILPTLLGLAGVPVPGSVEGENMAGVIGERVESEEGAALIMNVSHFAGEGKEYRGIYTPRYAYVKSLEGPWLMYDHKEDPFQMDNLVGKIGFDSLQEKLEILLQKELDKAKVSFRPREYYIEKWGYHLGEGRHIPYYFEKDLNSADSLNIEFQGPELNKKYRKE